MQTAIVRRSIAFIVVLTIAMPIVALLTIRATQPTPAQAHYTVHNGGEESAQVVSNLKPITIAHNGFYDLETVSIPFVSYEIYSLPNTSAPTVNSCDDQASCDALSGGWTIESLMGVVKLP